MPSQAVLKSIAALKVPKYRQKYGQFTVEGRKSVHELIHSNYAVDIILATHAFLEKNPQNQNVEIISEKEYSKISQFDSPPGFMAVAFTKTFTLADLDENAPVTLVLDGINDPGNLGTLIRTADWYGINQVVMSPDTADVYNAKAIAASMGSFCRCTFVYTPLENFLRNKSTLGCFLDGESVHQLQFTKPVYVVVGSEAHGIRPEVAASIEKKITIPGIGQTESLNVSVAAGIVLDNISRQMRNL